jgi:small redox-active disulfide protein 2
MKTIQVIGPGCPKCKLLAEHAEAAVEELGIEARVEKVTAIDQILALGVMATPAIAVDGVVKSSGRVLSAKDIQELLK